MDQVGPGGYQPDYGIQVQHDRKIADLEQRVTKLETEIRRLAGFIKRALGVED